MGICAYGDIFQAKVYEILSDNKAVNKYIDDILVIGSGSFTQHIDQIRVFLDRLRATGLKFNDPNRSFALKDITYLDYIITWEGNKPY